MMIGVTVRLNHSVFSSIRCMVKLVKTAVVWSRANSMPSTNAMATQLRNKRKSIANENQSIESRYDGRRTASVQQCVLMPDEKAPEPGDRLERRLALGAR